MSNLINFIKQYPDWKERLIETKYDEMHNDICPNCGSENYEEDIDNYHMEGGE